MKPGRIWYFITIVLLLLLHASRTQAVDPPKEKVRLLVDKVITRSSRELNDKQAGEIAAAGFNVVTPRWGKPDENSVRATAKILQRHGMKYLPWLKSTFDTNEEGLRLTWANGVQQDIYSPNTEEFWKLFRQHILTYAKVSKEYPNLIGTFLDFEIYVQPKQGGHAFPLSYDILILRKFAQSKGIPLPEEFPPSRRFDWLVENNLHDDFARFQINSWRKRLRTLRADIDAYNPRFQFYIYPITFFITEAIYPELATPNAPLVIADARTYSRPSPLMKERDAVEANRNYIVRSVQSTRKSPYPLLVMGGIDPILPGSDPEFCGKNASAITEVSPGYWVFYQGPRYNQPAHKAYMGWFGRANREIAEGRYDLWRQPRETPETAGEGTKITPPAGRIPIAVYGVASDITKLLQEQGRYQVYPLDGLSPEYLKQFKLILLQNFNVSTAADSELVKNLRTYVEQGGALFFTHDTIWYMDSPFPEIAERDIPKHKLNVEAGRHVVDVPFVITKSHPSVGKIPLKTTFLPLFRDSMIFKPGSAGTVVVTNQLGDPTYVVGSCGKGRVAFSGSYYGKTGPLKGPEKKLFLNLIDWLVTKK